MMSSFLEVNRLRNFPKLWSVYESTKELIMSATVVKRVLDLC